MAQAGGHRLLQIFCRADQYPRVEAVSGRGHEALARGVEPPQPEGPSDLDPHRQSRGLLASPTTYPSSLAKPAIRRYTPEVGAVCGKAARPDLCGGRGAILVPTATTLFAPCPRSRDNGGTRGRRPRFARSTYGAAPRGEP